MNPPSSINDMIAFCIGTADQCRMVEGERDFNPKTLCLITRAEAELLVEIARALAGWRDHSEGRR